MSEKERLLLTKSISGYFVSSVKENEKWGNIEQQYRISEEIYEDIEQLQQENKKYKEVIDKLKNIINEMINCGYIVENGESAVDYMATGSKSEFGTRAKVLLDILKEVQ